LNLKIKFIAILRHAFYRLSNNAVLMHVMSQAVCIYYISYCGMGLPLVSLGDGPIPQYDI
jgi:hypothetical protein